LSKRDYYQILNISRSASDQEIKSAYRKLAVKYHPDKNPGNQEAEEKFKEASEAYSVLSDPQKRAQFDRFGHVNGAGAGGFDPTIFSEFGDIFGDLFGFGDILGGGGRRRSSAQRGSDLRYNLELAFMEAAFGLRPRSKFLGWKLVKAALDPERLRAPVLPAAPLARVMDRSAISRVSSASAALATIVRVPATSSRIRARNVGVRVVFRMRRLWRSRFRPAWTMAKECGFRGKVRLVFMGARRAIWTSCFS